MLRNVTLLFIIFSFLSGCAAKYSSVDFFKVGMTASVEKDDFLFKYTYSTMQDMGNKRYVKYEMRNNVKVVGIQIINKTDKEIMLSNENFQIYAEGNRIHPFSPSTAVKHLKQNVIQYLLYAPIWLYINNDNDPEPEIQFPIGIPIALMNMLLSGSANSSVLKDLTNHNLIGKTIGPNTTINGLIVLYNTKYAPLDFEIILD